MIDTPALDAIVSWIQRNLRYTVTARGGQILYHGPDLAEAEKAAKEAPTISQEELTRRTRARYGL